MSIKSSYTSAPTRSYYKGTSFQYSGKWNEGNHYQCDEYVIDFVSLNNVLLKCNKSHTAEEWNKPIFTKDDKGCVIGIEPNEYWQFVIVGVDKAVYTDNNYTDIDKHFLTSIPGYNEETETDANVYSTEEIDTKLSYKVDKDGNKQLSDENYTLEEKTKLLQLPNKSTLDEQLANKQDILISGSNIKSINGESLLGSGNLEVITDISNKADKVQNAVNGNFAGLDGNGNLTDSGSKASDFATASDVSNIQDLIPSQATSSNQLADKAFVNSSIQTATATFRGTWSTWADVPADGPGDSSGYGLVDSDNNDYLVVRDASGYGPAWDSAIVYLEDDIVYYYDEMVASHEGLYKCIAGGTAEEPYLLNDWVKIDKNPDYLGTWRFKYVPEGQTYSKDNWKPEYQVNEEPLTAAQVAAINSGITSTLVSEFGAKYDKPSGGIPKTDLASAVQASLGLADSAVQDVTGKADKVSGASSGNFSGLDGNGNLTDSGYKPSDYYIKSEVNTLIGSIESFHYEIYSNLEDITSPQSNVLYLIGPTGEGEDLYEEYVYNAQEEDFVKIGDTSIDLSNYVTDSELATALISKQDSLTFDNVPTQNSNNPIKSGGVYTALAGKANTSDLTEYDNIIGKSYALEEFTDRKPFLPGQYVLYQDNVYRFIERHPAGAWTGTDAIYTSIFNELTNFVGTDTTRVHIELSSSDGELTLEGIKVSVEIEDTGSTTEYEADENGNVTFNIPKGQVFTTSVEQQTGYQTLVPIKAKATSDDKYLYFYYQPEYGGYCNVTVTAYTFGSSPTDPSIFEGEQVTLKLSNGEVASTTFNVNGVANFPTITKGQTGIVISPKIVGLKKPLSVSFSTALSSENVTVNYTSLSQGGIYITREDGVDFAAEDWDSTDTAVALHINTSTLQEYNADYYVKISDLCAGNNGYPQLSSSVWSTAAPNGYKICPNVNKKSSATDSNIDYDGQTNTANMISDAQDLDCTATSAEIVTTKTLEINNVTYYGFMGTLDQMRALYENQTDIYQICSTLGKSASYYGKNTWTSTQHASNSGSAWGWYSGSWSNNYRFVSYTLLPLFAI